MNKAKLGDVISNFKYPNYTLDDLDWVDNAEVSIRHDIIALGKALVATSCSHPVTCDQ